MASDVAQVEPRRKHHRAATPLDGGGDGESNMISKRHKRHRRLPHHVSEMADVEVDCDCISDETDGSARDYSLSSPTDGPRLVPASSKARDDDDDLEEGEILDNEGEPSQNPVCSFAILLLSFFFFCLSFDLEILRYMIGSVFIAVTVRLVEPRVCVIFLCRLL